MSGAFMEPIHVQYLVCENAQFRVEAHKVSLVWSPWLLVNRRLEVNSLRVEALTYMSKSESTQPLLAPDEISIPIAIDINSAEFGTVVIATADEPLELSELSASYNGDMRSHRLSVHSVASKWGQARGDITIGALAPLPVSAQVDLQSDRVENWPLSAQVDLSGDIRRLTATVQASAGALPVTGEIVLAPFDANPLVSIKASTADVDIAQFDSRLPHTALFAALEATPVGASALTGTLLAKNTDAGRLDQQRLPVQAVEANFALDMTSPDRASLRLSDVHLDLGAAGKASGSADIAKDHIALAFDVSQLNLQAARGDLRQTSLNGSMRVEHRDDRQLVTVDLRQKNMQLEGEAEVTAQRIEVKRMTARAGGAQLLAKAAVDLDDNLNFELDGSLKNFDPARFGEFPQASINGSLQVGGRVRPEWRADVKYQLGKSSLAGVALAGNGKLRLSPSRLQAADMQLDYGGNDLKLSGSFGNAGDALKFRLYAQRLDRLDKAASGKMQASGTLSGTLTRPAIKADMDGQKLAYEQFRVDAAQASITIEQASDPLIRVQSKLQRFTLGDMKLDRVDANVDGTLAAHAVELAVAAPELQLNGRLEGGWNQSSRIWSGIVARLENAGKYPLRMTRPATLELAQDRLLLGATDVVFSQTELSLGETRYADGSLVTKGSISGLRAARLLALMKEPPAVDTTLVLEGQWDIRAGESLDGFVELTRTDGDVDLKGD